MEATGMKPTHRTFLALLNACGTAGRVELAYVSIYLYKIIVDSSKSSFQFEVCSIVDFLSLLMI